MRSSIRSVVGLTLGSALIAPMDAFGSLAQHPEPIRYVLRFPAPATHYIEVEATYPTGGRPVVELMMAVWTPGSYLIREFARHVEDIRVRDPSGRALVVEKSRKNRWRVTTRGAKRILATYRVYANEHQARTNWVEDSFALINGAPTYLTLVERGPRPHEVLLELPARWARSLTSMPPAAGGRPHHYRTPDYDTLVDSPIIAGNPSVHDFSVDGVRHALVNIGEAGVWDGQRSARDAERIVAATRELWGAIPYERFLFFNLLVEGDDGIEHKGSTVLFATRSWTERESTYHYWLQLLTHEFFHAWNVKRLRPVELGPFDYENETYTKSLWIAEGLSDYYSWLLVRRAGLSTREQALADVSAAIRSLQSTPGRLVQPLELASYDAWIKWYRPDENTANAAVSYYTKGALVGLLLDARIRRVTNGAHSLDDVMRLAYRRYSGMRGYTGAEFRAVASEVAGTPLDDFFHRALESTEELDYTELLDWYGLQFGVDAPNAPATASLGLDTRVDNGRLVVSAMTRGNATFASGIAAGDELIAIGGHRLGADGIGAALERYRPGDTVTVTVTRRDQVRQFTLTLGSAQPDTRWSLAVRPDATEEQKRRLAAWLRDER